MIDCDWEYHQDYLMSTCPQMFDKDKAWDCYEQGLEKGFCSTLNTLSKQEAWDLYDPRTPCQIREDFIDKKKEERYDEHTLQILEWHHIEPVNDPYWKQCVNRIEERLK